MKKIVAIVLAMVMVMGLATTAFAAGVTSSGAESTATVTLKNASVKKLAGTDGADSMTDYATVTNVAKTTVTGKVDNDVAKYVPNIYNIDGKFYIEVVEASAQYALKNNGAFTWLYPSEEQGSLKDVIEFYATDVVIASFVAGVEVPGCGETEDPYYVTTDGDLFYAFVTPVTAANAAFAYNNGEFVIYDDTSVVANDIVKHVWKLSKVTYRGVDSLGHEIPVAIKCAECEKTFEVVKATKVAKTWKLNVNYVKYAPLNAADQAVADANYVIVLDNGVAAPSAPAAGETVESAKTFDAGIAMYVGMSVMAAAGSAVVLKKKD